MPVAPGSIRHKPSVFIFRPRAGSVGGGSISRVSSARSPRSPLTFKVERRPDSRLSGAVTASVLAPDDGDFQSIDAESNAGKVSIVEGKDGEVEIIMDDGEPLFFTVLEEANIDGVRHLTEANRTTRWTWGIVIILFVLLAAYQIFNQIHMWVTTPVATNIEADYPSQTPFPVVAICNNNQYRLTFLTGGRIQNRKPKNRTFPIKGVDDNSTNVFDK
ncbi:Amiloride-sensitive sodium channel family protein, partial [Aphelenchoides avenae]